MSLQFTHVDKIYFPKGKVTKEALLRYYAKVAKFMLPYMKDRPLVMRRYPNGIQGTNFFQKDVKDPPSFVKTASISHESRKVNYILVQNAKSLMYVANLGSIEMHLFHSRIKTLDKPDYLLIDLDPTSISFSAVIDTAKVIHDLLTNLKIPHFCKTSGQSGLHIMIPTKGKYSYEETKEYAKIIGKLTHQLLPKITSMERSPSKRRRRVYIDCLQNAKGQLAIAPYSARANRDACVSTPLSWTEVKGGLDPKDFTIKNVPARLSKKGDIFKGVLGKGCSLKVLNRS